MKLITELLFSFEYVTPKPVNHLINHQKNPYKMVESYVHLTNIWNLSRICVWVIFDVKKGGSIYIVYNCPCLFYLVDVLLIYHSMLIKRVSLQNVHFTFCVSCRMQWWFLWSRLFFQMHKHMRKLQQCQWSLWFWMSVWVERNWLQKT